MQSVGRSDSGGEFLDPLKAPNVLKEENRDFNKTVGIDLENTYARLREDELLGSNALFSPPKHYTDISSSQIYLGIETCLQTLMEKIMRS